MARVIPRSSLEDHCRTGIGVLGAFWGRFGRQRGSAMIGTYTL